MHMVNAHGENTTNKLPQMPTLLCNLGAGQTPWMPGNGLQIKDDSLGCRTPFNRQALHALRKKTAIPDQTNLIYPSPCLS
ncbi:hypothetical protein HRM2_27960 [Desulforapulum autotrophicum HRM2]|uniref:Uncharacterized protein n=1 Tax=Desulforapulum autotrophicum (strain ATCC 43914 / DSM 3382 / VKM B-1955 / HRM2) TaxID=177437 RepID=C0QJ72_DESAH|nr:hypothetical protein HRM2_27960 [Desulforapulum autotrophicum HRM2]